MEMNKLTKKLKSTLLVGIVALSISSGIVSAATYTAYVLPRWGGNNYTNSHVKTTNDKFIDNKVTAISGTSFANFWAVDDNNKSQSNKYKQNVSQTATRINFKNSSTLASGQNVKMAMENNSWQYDRGFVSGDVDFR